ALAEELRRAGRIADGLGLARDLDKEGGDELGFDRIAAVGQQRVEHRGTGRTIGARESLAHDRVAADDPALVEALDVGSEQPLGLAFTLGVDEPAALPERALGLEQIGFVLRKAISDREASVLAVAE